METFSFSFAESHVRFPFQISLNENQDFMTNRMTGVQAKVGYVTEITINPLQQIASEKFKELPLEKRNCRLRHEVIIDDEFPSLFKTYSQQSCEYMCLLKNLTKTQKCLPWDVPNIGNNPKVTLCYGAQTGLFVEAMQKYNPGNDPNCNCLPDCEKISYETKAERFALDNKIGCSRRFPSNFLPTAYYKSSASLNFERFEGHLIHDNRIWLERLRCSGRRLM